MEALTPFLKFVADVIALIGGGIMVGGAMVSFGRLGQVEWAALRKRSVEGDRRTLRNHLGYYILLGLEFIVVADVLRTILHPGWEELLILGAVVLIRTVISVTLNWELSRTEEVRGAHP
jgi:uncharacterized membrane protein